MSFSSHLNFRYDGNNYKMLICQWVKEDYVLSGEWVKKKKGAWYQ